MSTDFNFSGQGTDKASSVVVDSQFLRLRAVDKPVWDESDSDFNERTPVPIAFTNDLKRKLPDLSLIRPLEALPKVGHAEDIPISTFQPQQDDTGTTTALDKLNSGTRVDIAYAEDIEGGISMHSRSVASAAALSVDGLPSEPPMVSAEERALQKRKGMLHFFAICWMVFVMGWSDGTTGPMIPRLQAHYHVRTSPGAWRTC